MGSVELKKYCEDFQVVSFCDILNTIYLAIAHFIPSMGDLFQKMPIDGGLGQIMEKSRDF